ncbi:glycosyltransferase [Candidatus Parabeggiatoa sp. HSG14]|uniref:glycosyltransferase n=1 Tax=Candidatus Parabeggiatoa sp. HSG14 TaxID=3055593 RepID=UPI0025A7032E|nr:glycosyltransferase [Thiotrichales bacterium HSG14]
MNHINHLLIFEPDVTGHQPLYIRLLYSYLLENKSMLKVTFVIHPDINQRLIKEDSIELRDVENKINIVFLNETEILASLHNTLWIRAMNRWKLMKKYLKMTGANHGHFLYLDHIQFPLALRLPFLPGKKISGLLFQPPMLDFYKDEKNAKEVIRDYRKKWFYAAMLNNPALSFAYTINSLFPSYASKHFANGNKVYHLPDPSMFPTSDIHLNDEDCALTKHVRKNRKLFLLFGALTKRKGIFEVIEALKHLEPKYISQIAIVFAGKLGAEIRAKFLDKVASYKQNNSNANLHIEDRFLSTNEIICLLQHCDIILAPYSRYFVGSSGVLLWAVGAKKPVIAPNYGLLGYQVQKYHLGISIDATKPKVIADAFRRYLNNPDYYERNTSGMEQLHAESLPENFARIFFSKFITKLDRF